MKFNLKLLTIPVLVAVVGIACNIGAAAPSTPDPFATLNALYTAAVQTEQASGSPVATSTPGASLGTATATNALPTLSYKTNTPAPVTYFCNAAAFVDDIVVVEEQAIVAATRSLLLRSHILVEFSGAVGVAAIASGRFRPDGPTAVVLSGGNLDPTKIGPLVEGSSP